MKPALINFIKWDLFNMTGGRKDTITDLSTMLFEERLSLIADLPAKGDTFIIKNERYHCDHKIFDYDLGIVTIIGGSP